MTYDTNEARSQMLGEIERAADDLAVAISALGEAYEQLDQASADRLEQQLFRPVQAAYGAAKRTHEGFARRAGLTGAAFAPAPVGHPSQGVSGFLATAVESVARADLTLSELQDSMRPVEVGDADLRAGLTQIRQLLAEVPTRARSFTQTLGR